MGLMYIFPTEDSAEEINEGRVQIENETLTLKTYGLPMIFWGYLAAILVVVFAMWLASASVISKMLTYDDPILHFLAYLVRGTLIFGPIILLGFYFYEKFLVKKGNEITIIHRVFFFPVIKKKIILKDQASLEINHYLDSPNIAKMKNQAETKGFENKGYFELHAISNDKKIFLDRSSRKADLVKIQNLLAKF